MQMDGAIIDPDLWRNPQPTWAQLFPRPHHPHRRIRACATAPPSAPPAKRTCSTWVLVRLHAHDLHLRASEHRRRRTRSLCSRAPTGLDTLDRYSQRLTKFQTTILEMPDSGHRARRRYRHAAHGNDPPHHLRNHRIPRRTGIRGTSSPRRRPHTRIRLRTRLVMRDYIHEAAHELIPLCA